MRYVNQLMQEMLKDRLKVNNKRVNVRVEVDKLVYTPNLSTEIDYVDFWTDYKTPELIGGNTTSASIMISPVKDRPYSTLGVSSDFAVKSVNGKTRRHPIDGYERDHEGVDFNVGEGTQLVATADGVVTKVSLSGLRYVNILHINGVMTRYLHLGEIIVSEGANVVQGQEIAKVGAKDAYSTGAHLHFEVRVNATKTSNGSPRDPKDYLSGSTAISSISSTAINTTGTVTINNSRLRKEALITSEVIRDISKGEVVSLIGKVGEWYKVEYSGTQGYVFANNINVAPTDGSYGNDGVNPTYQEIVNYITQYSNSVGLPPRIALATAWTESGMRQYYQNGNTVVGDNGTSKDWGLMQINDHSWSDRYDFNQIKNDWQYNVRAGVNIALYIYNIAVRRSETDLVRATYSGYNGGEGNISRYRTTTDQRDVNFYNYYNSQPWLSKIRQGSGGEFMTGIVIGNVVNIRSSKDSSSDTNIVSQVNRGMTLETSGLEEDWFKVYLPDGREGYIHMDYFKLNNENITTDFQVTSVFKDDFESYSIFTIPPMNKYLQDSDKLWKIGNDGSSNNLTIKGGVVKSNYTSFIFSLLQSGKLTLRFKTNLSEGNKFNIYDNESIVYSSTGVTNVYNDITIPLLSGSHVIKFERLKIVDGIEDSISIDNINVSEFVYRDLSDKTLIKVDADTTVLDSLTVNGDGIPVYEDQNEESNVIIMANKGSMFGCSSLGGGWYSVLLNDGAEGFIHDTNNLCIVSKGGWKRNTLNVQSGGFIYDRTLTLSNIESINIDTRYDLRAGSATITLHNPGGYLSPDYSHTKFPEKGFSKSPFVEHYAGDVLGVLTENTPIRIYLGYGDNPPRKFTGLINSVDIDGDGEKITIKCTDMMKKLNDYIAYKEIMFPPNGEFDIGWLTSSVIHELASIGGLSGWRTIYEDLQYPDIIVEETYYVDVRPEDGTAMVMDETGTPHAVKLTSLSDENGYLNPNIVIGKTIEKGTSISDTINELCQDINFWQRCDVYGTYRCVPVEFQELPVAYFKDYENIITLNKTIDYSNTRNHIIVSGAGNDEHFFDKSLWRAVNGVRKTMQLNVPWADTYGKKQAVALKAFNDMKMAATTISVAIEGNPYLDLLDTIGIEHANSSTKDSFVIKGIKDSWSNENGYITNLDLFKL